MLPVVVGGNRCAQERKGGAEIETGESGATPDALSSGKVCAQNVTSVYRVTGVPGGGGRHRQPVQQHLNQEMA